MANPAEIEGQVRHKLLRGNGLMMQFSSNYVRNIGQATCIIVVTGLLASLSACRPAANPPQNSAAEKETPTAAAGDGRLLDGWETPLALLVFSGDEHGYLEPCGCSERQSGGFARRADFIRKLKEDRKWPVTAFDVGGILNAERITYPQSKIKFKHMLIGLNRMGYKGLQLGFEELLLGPDTAYVEQQNLAAVEGFDVPFMGENVTFYGTKDLGTPIGSRVVQVGSIKVGVIGIVGNSTIKRIQQTGLTADESSLKLEDPTPLLKSAIEKLRQEPLDLLVLLSHAEIAESEELAKQFPEFQIVVTANSAEDPRPQPNFVGETMIVQVGKKGKNVVAVGLYPEQKLRHELVELDMGRFGLDPSMIHLMREYQTDLKNDYSNLVNEDLSVSHPTGKTFAGAESCKDCHTYAYGLWSKTKHAHAIESLTKGREGQAATWVDRVWDPECLACHTTGWDAQAALRYQSGFLSLQETPHLAGQQCENCHGPAAEHVEFETAWKVNHQLTSELIESRKSLQLLKAQAEQKVCSRCHDHENSPKFDFEKYWREANHSGRKD